MSKQILIVMQGVPGSGKSWIAWRMSDSHRIDNVGLSPEHHRNLLVASTDDFPGLYVNDVFDPSKLVQAHQWNQNRVRKWLSQGDSVVVDNTNITCWQARPYVEMAVKLNIPVQFVRATGNFGSVHNVPPETIEKMCSEMEELTVEKCLAAKYLWEVSPITSAGVRPYPE